MTETDLSFADLFIPLTKRKSIIFIFLIGLVTYFNSFFNGFIGDDHAQIIDNVFIHQLANIPLFFKGSTLYVQQIGGSVGLYYRPVMAIVFSFIYSLFGAQAFYFHFFQLLLHIINAILVFLLIGRYIKITTAFIISVLFLILPINNEAVVYISNTQELLFSFFGLLALLLLSKKRFFYVTPLWILLSLLSKETGILFIPLTLLYYFLFIERTRRKTIYLLASFVFVFCFYLFLRLYIGKVGFETHLLYMTLHATFVQRLFTIPSILLYYITMFFFPVQIAFGWYWVVHNPNIQNFGIPLFILLMLASIALSPLYYFRKNKKLQKIYLFFILFFVSTAAVTLQIFPLDLTVADRWFYMSAFALVTLLGLGAENILFVHKIKQINKKYIWFFICALGLFFCYQDIQRNIVWSSDYEFCKHDVKINTTSYILEYCLSNELYNRQKYPDAKIHAQKAVALYPEYFLSWYTLAKIEYALHDKKHTEYALKKTLALNEFGLGAYELSLYYVYDKKPQEALVIARKYLHILPTSGELWYAVALASYQQGDHKKAVEAAKKSYVLQPTPLTYKVYYRLSKNLPITF